MHRVGCSGGLLTRRRAPQFGCTPLYAAAENGHQEVVQLLVQADADKNAPDEVTREWGGCWAHKRFVCFLLGVVARLLIASVLSRVGELCLLVNGRGTRWLTSAPGAGREPFSRVALQTRECRIKSIDSGHTPHYLDRREIRF